DRLWSAVAGLLQRRSATPPMLPPLAAKESGAMSAQVDEAVDVILRDGGTLRLRPPSAADREAVLAFFKGLSAGSLALRFHRARRVGRGLAEPYLDPDWTDCGALLGSLEDEVVALASYQRTSSESAEVAFVVADVHQRRGIGTRLLEQLSARAVAVGI